MSDQKKIKDTATLKGVLNYELEIRTDEEDKEELFVSFESTLENDLAAMAISLFHLRDLRTHALGELKNAKDHNERVNAQNALNSIDKSITGNQMAFSMMQNSYFTYRKKVQISAELVKLNKKSENEQKTSTDTASSDLSPE